MKILNYLFKKSLVILIFCTMACATKYSADGFKGGYEDFKLGPDVAKVKFRGNGYTSETKVQKYLMYRCAELTKASGYEWFVLLNSSSKVDKVSYQTSGSYSANTNYYGNNASTTGTYTPGQTYEYNKPSSEALIKMGSGPAPQGSIDANWILTNLAVK